MTTCKMAANSSFAPLYLISFCNKPPSYDHTGLVQKDVQSFILAEGNLAKTAICVLILDCLSSSIVNKQAAVDLSIFILNVILSYRTGTPILGKMRNKCQKGLVFYLFTNYFLNILIIKIYNILFKYVAITSKQEVPIFFLSELYFSIVYHWKANLLVF